MNNWLILIRVLIIITAFTKRAQFPFSSWLPVAIAAPTPVSSLVHSSTLVTAGIYLLILFNSLINNNLIIIILIIRLITIIISRISAIFEFDFKKIIAYSTLRQLGLIIIILSIIKIDLRFFHLIIHAIFKSIIFICSGVFIHNLLNYQDILYYGSIKLYFPLTCLIFLISNLSLRGIPFLSGFFSKDKILESIILINLNLFIYLLLIFRISITLIYRFLLVYYLINNNFNFVNYNLIIDSLLINISIIILIIFSIIIGIIINWIIFFSIEIIFLFKFEKFIIIIILILGLIIGLIIFKITYKNNFYKCKFFINKIWFSYYIIYYLIKNFFLGKNHFTYIDKGWIELISKNILIYLIKNNNLFNINLMNFIILLILLNWLILLLLLL